MVNKNFKGWMAQARTHIHPTVIVTTVSRSLHAGSIKMDQALAKGRLNASTDP